MEARGVMKRIGRNSRYSAALFAQPRTAAVFAATRVRGGASESPARRWRNIANDR